MQWGEKKERGRVFSLGTSRGKKNNKRRKERGKEYS